MATSEHITLRNTTVADLDALFLFQLDAEALHMAAFTPANPSDRDAYLQKFTALLADPSIHMKTILAGGTIAGSIAKFEIEGTAEITYWIDRQYWHKGIATAALRLFLALESARPLRARTASDNIGSQRVLEKCGFRKTGTDQGFANARQSVIDEFLYRHH